MVPSAVYLQLADICSGSVCNVVLALSDGTYRLRLEGGDDRRRSPAIVAERDHIAELPSMIVRGRRKPSGALRHLEKRCVGRNAASHNAAHPMRT